MDWAERQRNTNKLVRKCANYILSNSTGTPDQIYGLCQLTWITKSYDIKNGSYINATKIPGLENVFNQNWQNSSLRKVAIDLIEITDDSEIFDLVLGGSGFTNFYNAYRNSSHLWIRNNIDEVRPVFIEAFKIKSDKDARNVIQAISNLPGIPRGGNESIVTGPNNLLTPLAFSLDKRLRFPLINGNKGIKSILKKLGIQNETLVNQFDNVIQLIGKDGISDAADLDVHGPHLEDLISLLGSAPNIIIAHTVNEDSKNLDLKDEADYEVIKTATTVKAKRLHNKMTNQLKKFFESLKFRIYEGVNRSFSFDLLVANYDGKGRDLMIEVKSDGERATLRLAIGQILDYHFSYRKSNVDRAIILPKKPSDTSIALLKGLDIGLMWFHKDFKGILTEDDWLSHLVQPTQDNC